MRRVVAALMIVALAAVILAAGKVAAGSTVRVTVKPHSGGTATHFVVSFRAPARTGVVGIQERRYQLEATAPGSGCKSSVSANVAPTRKGEHVSVTLRPKGKRWCVARYRGRLVETIGPYCRPGQVCPKFATLIKTVARFSFDVLKGGTSSSSTTASDRTAPSFAGLQSAFACTPGPQTPGETTPFTLGWQAASDDQTPSGQIIYLVFMSTSSGGEDFTKPTWTTAPGVTTFKTPGLASHGTFYFVVRARDQAGNEDQNRVERRGVDPCV
jgi:uncharacterized protein (DUF58 family)